MPYTPQTWTDLPSTTTPLSAARLTAMETGIDDAHTTADAIAAAPIIVSSATGALSAERVLTDTATVTWDFSVGGQAKATAIGAAPTGAAGGSLAGTYPNPTIASSVSLPGSPTTTTQSAADNSTKVATTAYVDTAVSTGNSIITANTQTGSYTLVLGDAGKVIEQNVAGANTLTVPPNSSVAFPVGTVIEVYQMGAGQVTLTPGAGVTIRNPSSLTTRAQYSTVSIRKRATDEWVASGDLT